MQSQKYKVKIPIMRSKSKKEEIKSQNYEMKFKIMR